MVVLPASVYAFHTLSLGFLNSYLNLYFMLYLFKTWFKIKYRLTSNSQKNSKAHKVANVNYSDLSNWRD